MGHFFREKRSPNHHSDHFPFKGPAQNLQFFAPNLIGKQKPTPPWCPGPTNNNAQFLEHVIGHKVHATLFMNFRQSWEEKNRFNKLTTPNDLWILYHTYTVYIYIYLNRPMLYKCRKHVSLYVYCIYFLCVCILSSLSIYIYISYEYYIRGSFTSVSFARIHPYTTGSN